jgi:hypothetical protein
MPPHCRGPAVRHFATAEKNSEDLGVCEVGVFIPQWAEEIRILSPFGFFEIFFFDKHLTVCTFVLLNPNGEL